MAPLPPPAAAPPPSAASDAALAAQPRGWAGLDTELVGKLCLLGVAMLWGSYNPMLKMLYAQDGPPGPVMIMVFRGVLQSGVLVAAYLLTSAGSAATPQQQQQQAPEAAVEQQDAEGAKPSLVPAWAQRLASKLPYTALAAAELGTWLFLATGIQVRAAACNLLLPPPLILPGARRSPAALPPPPSLALPQTVGLQLTTATRAGFLIQATALLTPLLASFAGQRPSRNVWIGCMVALAGCLCIATDASAVDADDVAAFSLGE